MKLIVSFSIGLLVASGLGLSASPPERKQVEAQLLEQNSFLCSGCFFGASDYYFCFAADNRILLGRAKIPVINWQDPRQNGLSKFHKAWKTPTAPGETFSIQYDDRHIWMPGADGKQIRLTQDYSRDIFTNPECRAAVKKPEEQ